jgi:hypothetical protein
MQGEGGLTVAPMIDPQSEISFERPADSEALRLVVAFFCIMEPEKRAEVVALAERYASESRVVDGATHFLMLQKTIGQQD